MTNSNKHLTPDSSTINSIDHNGEKLIVEFKSGGTYHYDAPESVYHEMKAAPSAGKFLHANVKGKFNHAKVAIIMVLTLLGGAAYACEDSTTQTDYTCVGQCEAGGYQHGLCIRQCTY